MDGIPPHKPNEAPLSSRTSRRWQTYFFGLFKLVVSAALLVWIIGKLDTAAIAKTLAGASPALLVAGLALETLSIGLASWRWQRILAIQGLPLPFSRALRLVYVAQFINQALPANIGGDMFRSWHLFRDTGHVLPALSAVLFDRVMGLAGLALVAGLGLPYLILTKADGELVATVSGFVVTVAAVLLSIVWLGRINPKSERLDRTIFGQALHSLLRLIRDGRRILSNRGRTVAVLALSMTVHLLTVGIVLALAQAIDVRVDALAALAVVPPVILMASLPVSYAGWGVREGAMVFALGFLGVRPEAAVAVSLMFGMVSLAASLPGIVLWFAASRRRDRKQFIPTG
jgi:glycosyltransferase 2 family protein